ncbi:hypothetical protein Bca101_026356 [Brassica carinata]
MADLVLPNLSDEIICKIIALVGEESFWHFESFMRAGKRRYGLVHDPSVLKTYNVIPMLNFVNMEIGIYGKFRDFFLKCVNAGNINAVYLEGLHLASVIGLSDAIHALQQNVPTHLMSNLSVGIFNLCLGNDIEAGKVFQEFGANHEGLMSDAIFDIAEELEWRLTAFGVPNLNTYGPTLIFPDDWVIKPPQCHYGHDGTHDFEGSCNFCRLFWLCCNICHML